MDTVTTKKTASEYGKEYYQKNRDRVLARTKAYYLKNKEAINARNRAAYAARKAAQLESSTE